VSEALGTPVGIDEIAPGHLPGNVKRTRVKAVGELALA
jgi:hypothetical protein